MADQGDDLIRPAKRPDTGRWFAVQTKPRAEQMVHKGLKRLGYATLHLRYPALVSHARKKIGVERAYFPGYLFVHIAADQSAWIVNHHPGALGLVHAGDAPLEVPVQVIEELREKGDSDGLMPADVGRQVEEQRRRMAPGTAVHLVNGPFAGFVATVALDEGPKLRLWVEGFFGHGRVPLDDVPVGFVERLSP